MKRLILAAALALLAPVAIAAPSPEVTGAAR